MKMVGSCDACEREISLADKAKFIFTYRYNCECGAKYKLGQVSVIVLTITMLVLARVLEYLLGIDWLINLCILLVVSGVFSIYFLKLYETSRR